MRKKKRLGRGALWLLAAQQGCCSMTDMGKTAIFRQQAIMIEFGALVSFDGKHVRFDMTILK